MEDRGWNVLNGNTYGNEKGEYMYIGPQGNSTIDYAITNIEAIEKVQTMKIQNRIETDHQPILVTLKTDI